MDHEEIEMKWEKTVMADAIISELVCATISPPCEQSEIKRRPLRKIKL
jgi:hypothetical protein